LGLAPPPPPPSGGAAANTVSSRVKAVRLARLNPGLLRRLEDVGDGRVPWGGSAPQDHRSGSTSRHGAISPGRAQLARVNSDLVPFPPAPALMGEHPLQDLDGPGKWSLSLPPVRRAVGRRFSGEAIDPLASLGSAFQLRGEFGEERPSVSQGQLREIEALRRHCAELNETIQQLRQEQVPMEISTSVVAAPLEEGTCAPALDTDARAGGERSCASSGEVVVGPKDGSSLAMALAENERLRAELQAVQRREEQALAQAKAAAAECCEAACRASEAEARAKEMQAQCDAALEAQTRLLEEAEERARSSDEALAEERQLRKEAELALQGRGAARERAFSGGSAWASTSERGLLLTVMTAWRTSTTMRCAVGALQAKLFTEQACRDSALRSQKAECDARQMDAEARHRSALLRVRAELAEAEARHADTVAVQEADSSTRLAAAEADFAEALRQAVHAPVSAVAQEAEAAGESSENTSSLPAAPRLDTEARFAEAFRTLRARAEARLADAEVRHAEALLSEHERTDQLLAGEERRHEEALQDMQEAAERRLTAVEARHAEALKDAQRRAEQQTLDTEYRHMELLCMLQAGVTLAPEAGVTFLPAPPSGDGEASPEGGDS